LVVTAMVGEGLTRSSVADRKAMGMSGGQIALSVT
jgi:hypothetical protein